MEELHETGASGNRPESIALTILAVDYHSVLTSCPAHCVHIIKMLTAKAVHSSLMHRDKSNHCHHEMSVYLAEQL